MVTCMTEGPPQPIRPDPIASEAGNTERAVSFITQLIQQQSQDTRYNPKEMQMYNMLQDLVAETTQEGYPDFVERDPRYTIAGLNDMVEHVLLGYGSLIFDTLPPHKQARFLYQARREQEVRGGELELTEVEGNILKSIAAAVDREYDPGSREQRTFLLADIEKQAPDPATVGFPENHYLDPNFRRS